MYSYIDVLRGYIPASAFRNKHVLIGRAAAGLDITLATPSGAYKKTHNTIELIAHITNGALRHQHMASASPWANQLFNLIPVALGLAALTILGPSMAFFACIGLALAMVAASILAPSLSHMVFSPAAGLLGLFLAYPLWSWRRLSAATQYLSHELKNFTIKGLHPSPPQSPKWDFLQRRIDAVEHATEQLHQLHQFVANIMLQLPSPTLACNKNGQILLANSAAEAYAQSLQRDIHTMGSIADLLEGSIERDCLKPLWDKAAPPPLNRVHQCEGIDLQKRSILMLCRPFAIGSEMGWLVSLVDISDLREVIAQRDQAMHFISHDIRAPIGAILTVIEMEQHEGKVDTNSVLLQRIQRYARSSLALAEDFVHLARAQNATPQRTPIELGNILDQALDDMWAVAKERFVELEWMPQEEEAWVLGDASMLRRSCTNLISNAIKYGPIEGTVFCSLTREGKYWCINIRDQGEGISPEELARLFAPFTRQAQHERSPIRGIGLGLAYVDAVAKQHEGSITVHSDVGHGSCFTLRLPAIAAPSLAAVKKDSP